MNIRGVDVRPDCVVVTVFDEADKDAERYLRWASVSGGDNKKKADQLTAIVRNGTLDIEPQVEVTVLHTPSLSATALPYQVSVRTLVPHEVYAMRSDKPLYELKG